MQGRERRVPLVGCILPTVPPLLSRHLRPTACTACRPPAQGEIATHMYFIRAGSVQIFRAEDPDNPITQLSAGSYFGEFAILAVSVPARARLRVGA